MGLQHLGGRTAPLDDLDVLRSDGLCGAAQACTSAVSRRVVVVGDGGARAPVDAVARTALLASSMHSDG